MFDNIGGMLSGALGAVGSVLDAPRSMVYSGLINPAYHALGGDPNRQIGHFSDLLGAAGMDQSSWLTKGLGMVGDAATDPLTYAGALGGDGLARMLPGFGEEALAAGRGGESLASAGDMKDLMSGVTKYKGAMEAPGVTQDVLTEPFTREGDLANVVGSDQGGGYAARVVGGRGSTPGEIQDNFDALAQPMANSPGLQAAYAPNMDSTITREGASPRAIRHENVHALIDQASKAGSPGQLPSSLMSVPAQLMSMPGGRDIGTMTGGFGSVGDELAAQTLENRGTVPQLQGAANFLFSPPVNAGYASQWAGQGMNPVALNAYRAMRYAPAAAGAALGAGTGALSDALGSY